MLTMKKIGSIILASITALVLFSGCSRNDEDKTKDGKLVVYASFYPMYDFASKIGGDKINVANMVPAGTEPHDWEPTTSDIVGLEKADVFVYNGAGMEHWAEDVLESLSNKDLIVVETSKGVTLRKGHHHDENEDKEESYDPHVWLDPMNAKKQMENIKDAFVQADPENKDYYDDNYSKYAKELDDLDKAFSDSLSVLPKKDIVVNHEAFGYLCAAYNLTQHGISGLSPEQEPDPATMTEIIDFVNENGITVIFFEELASSKVAESIAKTTGVKVNVLNPLEGLSEKQKNVGDDYFSVMRQNLDALKEALK